jgi:hypothetical protein
MLFPPSILAIYWGIQYWNPETNKIWLYVYKTTVPCVV